MMFKMIKFVFRKCVDLGKWALAFFIFNKYSTKILNGVVK